jgi:poly(hydroxyalkanoate) depolymerase family esterase
LLDETYAKSLKVEHGADVWSGAARPARLKTDQKLREGLIKCKRRTWCYGRLLEIEPCRKLDCGTCEAPMTRRGLHQSFMNKNLLEHVVVGKRVITDRGLVVRAIAMAVKGLGLMILIRRHLRAALCCTLFAALVTIGCITRADAAEPREETEFGSNPGNLRMFSYVPEAVNPAAPLIVILHGCKQKATTFASDAGWLALADRAKIVLLLPEQKGLPPYLYYTAYFPALSDWFSRWYGANNPLACFNWFNPEDTKRDRGEALSIRKMIGAMIARYSIDRSRVHIVGLSAGGAMTVAMLAAYPELFAGGATVAGVPYGCADNASAALHCMNPGTDLSPDEWRRRIGEGQQLERRAPRISIWQGDVDTTVVPLNEQQLVKQWTAVHRTSAIPIRTETNGPITREVYADNTGATEVESVVVKGLGHAFPIRTDGPPACGQPGDYVVAASVCAATEISRFWGLTGDNNN